MANGIGRGALRSAVRVAMRLSLMAVTAGIVVSAQAQTLRWSTQGDSLTMDPHSQNEGLTNSLNGQIHETLVTRDKQLQTFHGPRVALTVGHWIAS